MELLDRGASQISIAMSDIHSDDPARHIARLAFAIWRSVSEIKAIAQMLVSGPLEKSVGEALAPVRRSLRDAVERGRAEGSFRRDIDAAVTARLIEEAALGVLDVAVEHSVSDEDAHRVLAATALGIAGLSWREARDVIESISAPSGTRGVE